MDNVYNFQTPPLPLASPRRLLVFPVFPGRPLFPNGRIGIPLCMMSASSFQKSTSQSWLAFLQLSGSWDLGVPSYMSSTSASSCLFLPVSFAKDAQSTTLIAPAGALKALSIEINAAGRPFLVAFHELQCRFYQNYAYFQGKPTFDLTSGSPPRYHT